MGYREIDWKACVFVFVVMSIAVSASLLAGCTTVPQNVPVPGANYCDVQEAYRPPKAELQHVARAPYTTDYLLKTNKYGQAICNWPEQEKST